MFRLIQITQIIFCLVSMILTSLFALSLSGVTIDGLSDQEGWGKTVFLAVLFVLIGCCIDISKYLFWAQRQRSRYYVILSLILMVFSWLASCAFLASSEHSLIQESQIRSDQYMALLQRIDSAKAEISFHERLLEKRLNSAYHSQWKEGEVNVDKIATLNSTLTGLMEGTSDVGLEAATKMVPTTRFFTEIGQVLNVGAQVIRAIGYGLLSLLLEVNTLGMISLARALKLDVDGDYVVPDGVGIGVHSGDCDVEVKPKTIQLTNDILQGRIPPVLRKIKAAHYDLNLDVIRQVLKSLFDVGILEQDKRNSYKINENFKID